MALELRPSSPSRLPPTTPAKIDLRPARPAPASGSPNDAPLGQLFLHEADQQQHHAQPQQLFPITKLPAAATTTPNHARGDDSPQTTVSLSFTITRRDMGQSQKRAQGQNQQDQQEQLPPQPQPQPRQLPDAREPNGSQPLEAKYTQPTEQLPAGCKIIKMVGEGAANAVFEFTLPDGSYLKHDNTRLLLRVAKMFDEDDRPKFNYHEQYEYYNNCIKPILGSYVLYQELVGIDSPGTIDNINAFLRSINSTRAPKFRGSYVESSKLGFLVEDMRPDDPSKSLLVEFKPKWLSQSPSAPAKAIRCRQCAKELHSYVTEPGLKRPVPTKAKPCPLTLNSSYHQTASDSSQRLVPHLDDLGDDLSRTLDVLRDEEAFGCLRAAQKQNDVNGPLAAEPRDTNFALAMTLRDCTCFAVVSTQANLSASRPLKVRFGDFDMKMPQFRLEYWKGVENTLIKGGFYTARWIHCDDGFYTPPTNCLLESPSYCKPLTEKDHPEIIDVRSPEAVANERGEGSAAEMEKTIGRLAVVYDVQSDAPTLTRCLAAYKTVNPRELFEKKESKGWFTSCIPF